MSMTTLDDLETKLRVAVEALPTGLRDHILRVETEARVLALAHNVDEQRAAVAALGHDLVRHLTDDALLAKAAAYDIEPNGVEKASPILLHGPIAACMLTREYGVVDREICDGIDCHTTARAGMTDLEHVLFIADKVEPHKLAREAVLGEVKELACRHLRAATLRYLDYNLEQAVRRRWLVHPRSLEARNELLTLLEERRTSS